MNNKMKTTICKLCGKNLTNYNYEYQTKHIKKCYPQQTLNGVSYE